MGVESPWVIIFAAGVVLFVVASTGITIAIMGIRFWFTRVEEHIAADHRRRDDMNVWMGKITERVSNNQDMIEAIGTVLKMRKGDLEDSSDTSERPGTNP